MTVSPFLLAGAYEVTGGTVIPPPQTAAPAAVLTGPQRATLRRRLR